MTETQSVAPLPAKSRVELGIAGGLAASVVMAISIIVLSSLGLLQVAWFPMIGGLFGAGFGAEAAIYGLAWYLVFGVVWGLIFAFVFRSYSVMKGLGIAGIGFIVMVIALALVSTPELPGTLLSLSMSNASLLLVSLAVGLAFWGATVGYIGKRYTV